MSVVSWSRQGSVAVVSFDNGENRHNPTFVAEFLATMAAVEADAEVHAVVLTSSDAKNWSLGIDLNWIGAATADRARHDEVRGFLRGLNDVYARVLTFPTPVIAAIGGHAFGGGAILACACDYRLMRSDRGFFCFPEVDVNIPFLPGMLAIVQRAVPAWLLDDIYLSGRRLGGQEVAEKHIAVQACDGPEALQAAALAFAGTFHKGRAVMGEIKRRKHAQILKILTEDDAPYIQRLALVAK